MIKYVAAATLLLAYCLPGQSLTPAGKAIDIAQVAIAKEPDNPEHHRSLALAYSRRARETSDAVYYDRGLESIAKALDLSPGHPEALKVKAWLLLGKHEFADALALAKELRKRTGDDETVYGLLTDANVELGNYMEAEDAAQWMLNVGRSSVPGLTRAAHLRELFGDTDGALELLHQAFNRISPAETEDRAWTLVQIAHLLNITSKADAAAQVLDEALRLMPNYHYAIAGLAKVRQSQGKYEEAVRLLRRRYELAPHPENLFDLGAALRDAGNLAESRKVLEVFERRALEESTRWDNANRELVAYYTDFIHRPAAALAIAELEYTRRKDVYTLDAFAWALHKAGRSREALKHSKRALAVGTADPRILFHAGAIARSLTFGAKAKSSSAPR